MDYLWKEMDNLVIVDVWLRGSNRILLCPVSKENFK